MGEHGTGIYHCGEHGDLESPDTRVSHDDHIFVILFVVLFFVQSRVRFPKKESFRFLHNNLKLCLFFLKLVKADDTNFLISHVSIAK